MTTVQPNTALAFAMQQKYRDNFARHILSISLYLQSEIMNALTLKHGHSQLRINFEPYLAIGGEKGARLSDIAQMLGISRQAANQTANQIEKAGYLVRTPDPSDGRAKLLTPTPRAKALLKQGAGEAQRLQQQFAGFVGDKELQQATDSVAELGRALGLLLPFEQADTAPLAGLLPRLSDYITNRLLELTTCQGTFRPEAKLQRGTDSNWHEWRPHPADGQCPGCQQTGDQRHCFRVGRPAIHQPAPRPEGRATGSVDVYRKRQGIDYRFNCGSGRP